MNINKFYLLVSLFFWFHGIVEGWLYNKGYGKPAITFIVNYKKKANKSERNLLLISLVINLIIALVLTTFGFKLSF